MKQTAVNSLIEQLLPFIDRSEISDTALQNIIEGHLAMEKEQIIEAHGAKKRMSRGASNYEYWYTGEMYYNETFKK